MALTTPVRVNVLASAATQLISAQTAFTERVIITNNGPNAIFLGLTNGVTATNGFALPATTGSVTFNAAEIRNLSALWAIAVTADQVAAANTSILVTTRE